MRSFFLICIFASIYCNSFANNEINSLRNIIKNNPNDSVKIMAYTNLVNHYYALPTKALEILSEMNVFCENNIKNLNWKALCLRKIGIGYGNNGFFEKALEYTFKSAALFAKLNDREGLAHCYNNIANWYTDKGELTKDKLVYKRAIEYHLKALKIRIETNDTNQVCNSYSNLGGSYMAIDDYKRALTYINKALELYIKFGVVDGIELCNSNLGNCYFEMGIKEKNSEYLKKSLSYFMTLLKNFNLNFINERYAEALARIGQIHDIQGNSTLGISFLIKGLNIGVKIKNNSTIMFCSLELSKVYKKNGEFKKALDCLELYNANKDSLINRKSSNDIEQMQAIYQTNQKDKEIEKLNNERLIKDAKLSRQRTIIFSSVIAVILILILAIVIWSRYSLKKKANVELGNAYEKIEIKNKQITDSINYSKRIQTAILPPSELLTKNLNNFFIYYSPKDIVSGDFYWFSNHNDRLFFIVVDCTGHGVPGALMSMIGNTLLNEIINQKNIYDPGEILNYLNEGVKNSLRQSNSDLVSQDDGMDVSICMLDKKNATTLNYACANHSIFIKSNQKVVELNGDIFSIGGDFGATKKKFVSKIEILQEGSFVILSTDGYYDQFGGDNDSKFLISRFEEMILETELSKPDIADKIGKVILDWRGPTKQTDDILVAGFKI